MTTPKPASRKTTPRADAPAKPAVVYATDPATGLPLLGRGYRWSVQRKVLHPAMYGLPAVRSDSIVVVKVEEEVAKQGPTKRSLFGLLEAPGDMSTEWSFVGLGCLEEVQAPTAERVRQAAQRIMRRWDDRRELENLIGHYPPKKLERR